MKSASQKTGGFFVYIDIYYLHGYIHAHAIWIFDFYMDL